MKTIKMMATMAVLCLPMMAKAETIEMTCNSLWDLYTECEVDGEIERASLTREFSNSPCIEGDSWGYRRGGRILWVDEGCRGSFRVRLGNNYSEDSFTMRCESQSHNTKRCDTGVRNRRVELERQLSSASCREGRSWDWDRYSIRVEDGCRAIFRVYPQ